MSTSDDAARSICDECGRPEASQADCESYGPGEGEHLCWGGGCEPTPRAELRAEIAQLRAELEASAERPLLLGLLRILDENDAAPTARTPAAALKSMRRLVEHLVHHPYIEKVATEAIEALTLAERYQAEVAELRQEIIGLRARAEQAERYRDRTAATTEALRAVAAQSQRIEGLEREITELRTRAEQAAAEVVEVRAEWFPGVSARELGAAMKRLFGAAEAEGGAAELLDPPPDGDA